MNIYTSADQLIGATPLLEFTNLERAYALQARLLGKLEAFNPAGSAKDRVALYMLEQAQKQGRIQPGSVIIEPTSGNTGIGLAAVGAARGYETVIVMPDSMSPERRQLIAAYGARLVLTPGEQGMAGAIAKAKELASQIPGSFIPGQFENPANPQAHYETTGPEIWRDTGGAVDIFVAGIGTGGTVSGAGAYLKEKKPSVQIVGIEPAASPVLSGGAPGPHGLQGIGAGFKPAVLREDILDRIITVTEEDAYAAGQLLGKREGILAGISSGAALWAAIKLAKEPENRGKTLVVLLPDTGDRYLSTPLYQL